MKRISFLPRHRQFVFVTVLAIIILTVIISIMATVIKFNDEGNVKTHIFLYNATQLTLTLDDTSLSSSTSFGLNLASPALTSAALANKFKFDILLDKFLIEADFYSVDITGGLIKARVHITVPPQYRGVQLHQYTYVTNTTYSLNSTIVVETSMHVPSSSIPNTPLSAVIGSSVSVFQANKLIEDFDMTVSMDGDLSDYPFDMYSCMSYYTLYRSAQVGNSTNKLPIGIAITGALQGFRIDPNTANFSTIEGSDEVGFRFVLRRSPITIGFSTFITVLMWLISVVMFTISLDVILGAASSTHVPVPSWKLSKYPGKEEEIAKAWRKKIQDYRKARQVSAPLLAMPVALIFALPALRNVQPGVPPVGAYCDVVGFFWNVGMVAMAAVGISSVWLIRRDV